jgi:hypothetical protein
MLSCSTEAPRLQGFSDVQRHITCITWLISNSFRGVSQMFDQLVKRSNCVWIYKTGRFAEERRIFLEEMSARGYGLGALRIVNPILLAVAERVNIRRPGPITEGQILRAAEHWIQKA